MVQVDLIDQKDLVHHEVQEVPIHQMVLEVQMVQILL